jgi:hypothetical protein
LTISRKLGTVLAPLDVPAKKKFVFSFFQTAVRVPDVVTGEPDTVYSAGKLRPTLVTLPTPPGRSVATKARNVGVAAPPLAGPAKTVLAVSVVRATARVPEVVIGEPATVKKLGTVIPTLVTVPPPIDVFVAKVTRPSASSTTFATWVESP